MFAPNEMVSMGVLDESQIELYRGNWGVGSNGAEFPSYQGRDGNAFIKVPAGSSSTGTDMLGTSNLDGSNGTQLVVSKTGTPVVNVRNFSSAATGAWYRVYSSADKPTLSELGAAAASDLAGYVPVTRTKGFSAQRTRVIRYVTESRGIRYSGCLFSESG